jgi:hypothetical protein
LVPGFSIQSTLAHFVRQEPLLLTGVSFAVMPHVKKQIGGPIWFQLLVGLPPIMIFSVGCAGLAGGALPAFAQLAVSTYHAASASSHAAISQVTVHVEEQKSHPNSKSQLEDSQPKPTSPQTAISQMR